MQGLEIARAYFETYGLPMLQRDFPDLMPHLAAGLFGQGSECFGFDDAISRDHDFEPGFCLFLPDEETVDRRRAFLLERAYAKLPKEFMGLERQKMAPVGGPRHGVFRTAEFFKERTGSPDGVLSLQDYLSLPEYALAEAVNGEIFFDARGEVTKIRERLAFYPEEVRLKKLAGQLFLAAQSGQYNFMRCVLHGEKAAAQLAACEFVKSAVSAIFLLNKKYQPYYKWSFRALRALPRLSQEAEILEAILTGGDGGESAEKKQDLIETASAGLIDELQSQGLTKAVCGDLEKHAYSVNDQISDPALRNLHVLAAV